jgi:ABC-type uncharacterized transport system substrate-binding protein
MRTWFFLPLLFMLVMAFASPAHAHPHAWISVKVIVYVNEKGEVTALREHWLFDKMYSAYAVRDFNPNKNGKFTDKDLLPLAQENVSNLKSYAYFTVFEDGHGKSVGLKEAKDVASSYETLSSSKEKVIVYATPKGPMRVDPKASSKQIAMDFTVSLAMPVDLRMNPAVYRIYDPTYYTDIGHYEHHPVTFVSEKDGKEIGGCRAQVELPKVDEKMLFSAAALDKNAVGPDNLGYYFSEKVMISCSAPKS